MRTRKDGAVLRQLGTLFNVGAIRELTDGQLLERFSTGRGEAAELAFAALVERHGAMVLRVCRARLIDPHDTQDAFQATFLILVKKARSLWVQDSLGPWLHQVAVRTAASARSTAIRRRWHESKGSELTASRVGRDDAFCPELRARLHEEIDRLPERYRVPIMLCDLEGQTCEEAARQMGRPVGTVKSWRSRGRERLRQRLVRSGLAPSAAIGAVLASDGARAAYPRAWTQDVAGAAVRLQSSRLFAGAGLAFVDTLVNGATMSMLFNTRRNAIASVCAVGALAMGLAAAAMVNGDDPDGQVGSSRDEPARVTSRPQPPSTASLNKDGIWPLTLRDAIRIGLANSKDVRLVASNRPGVPHDDDTIAPVKRDDAPQAFRSMAMCRVQRIAREYWELAQYHRQLWGGEKEVELIEEVKKREEAGLGADRGNPADVAETTQRLEQARLDLVANTSDVITAERRLRNDLGLPAVDNRRIVPVSTLEVARVVADWDACKATMLDNEPRILRVKEKLSAAQRALDAAISAKSTTTRQSALLKQAKSEFDDTLHERIHNLSRFVLTADWEFKQYQLASHQLTWASEHLESRRTDYEARRLAADRYVAAVTGYSRAVSEKAVWQARYKITLLDLEEAQGTLLKRQGIAVAASATADSSAPPMSDDDAGHRP